MLQPSVLHINKVLLRYRNGASDKFYRKICQVCLFVGGYQTTNPHTSQLDHEYISIYQHCSGHKGPASEHSAHFRIEKYVSLITIANCH